MYEISTTVIEYSRYIMKQHTDEILKPKNINSNKLQKIDETVKKGDVIDTRLL